MKLAIALAATIVMVGCTDTEEATPGAGPTATIETPKERETAAFARSGSEIYAASCAECHGKDGEGAEKGISLIKGHALYHSEEDFLNRVTNGKKDVMPAFRDKLTEAEIAEVVRFVREGIQGPFVKKKSASKQ